jgi:hypothetical protein
MPYFQDLQNGVMPIGKKVLLRTMSTEPATKKRKHKHQEKEKRVCSYLAKTNKGAEKEENFTRSG